jgi:prepilin-type N-terminal cleavage/methylation domain-containing protein
MKNKGFTLVELLVTIGILALLVLIASPTMDYIMSNSAEKTYQETINNIKEAARLYYTQQSTLLPQEIGDQSKVTINQLKEWVFFG